MRPEIAVVGLACRVPGAGDVGAFWRNLRAGVESVHFFNDAELRAAGVPEQALRSPHYVKAAPLLDGYDCFDEEFFTCSPREAAEMDPQHRVLLECAWEALHNAGCDPLKYRGAIGLFAGGGGSISSYLLANADHFREHLGATAGPAHLGNDKDFLTSRVSFKLNLRGPSVNVQTACSTSLVAVHLACQSLLAGECDMALAGGVSVRIPQICGYFAREGDILSPDGHCRPFDARARGTLFGSGVGLIALKRLDRALADGDHIWAVIRGSAVNNDGRDKLSYTASSVEGQEHCIRAALAAAGVDPATIGFVEAHGTATVLGDPLEIQALNRAFGRGLQPCGIGSVKGNAGHLEAAAGVIGLIKAVLALKHGEMPPSINFAEPNPRIDFAAGPFRVCRELADWPTRDHPRRAGVNSLGVGGTNGFVILEEAPAGARNREAPPPARSFRRRLHALPPRAPTAASAPVSLLGPARSSASFPETTFETTITVERFPFLADHRLFGEVVVPGAAYVAMALTAAPRGENAFGVEFIRPLALRAGQSVALQLAVSHGEPQVFGVFSRSADEWRKHATGSLLAAGPSLAERAPSVVGWTEHPGADVYDRFAELGLQLGPAFRVVRRWWSRGGEVLAEIGSPAALDADSERYFIHPALLDGCIQLVVGNLASQAPFTALFLPLAVERMNWWQRPGRAFLCQMRARPADNEQTVTADLTLFDLTGTPIAEVRGLTCKRATRNAVLRSLRWDVDDWLHTVVWRNVEESAATLTSTKWLILPDSGGVAKMLAQCLPGCVVSEDTGHLDRCDGVIDCRAVDATPGNPAEHQPRLLGGILDLAQALTKCENPPRCVVLTRGAQRVDYDASEVALAQAPIWGFVRALQHEFRSLKCTCIDLDLQRPAGEIDLLVAALADEREDEIALRGRQRFVPRLVPVNRADRLKLPDGPFRLHVARRGAIDNLTAQPVSPRAPGPGEIQIEVRASGLNFRDVLNALGLYPGDAGLLGMECAGIVRAVGAGVLEHSEGDEVVALASGSLANHVVAPAASVARKPKRLTFAEAAGLPVIFATAELALSRLAKLRCGERVLIHGAAGGVGWAAIQVARRVGAQVFATASRRKWEFLRAQGVDHIHDSRSLEFVGRIREEVGGVDVVLNSFSGEFIPASLSLLNRGGRFVEIGKQGIWSSERVAEGRPDVAYHVLALDRLMIDDPASAGEVLREVLRAIDAGELQPAPIAAAPVTQARSLFRRMQQARHLGKIVLEFPTEPSIQPDGTYLITGGTGGLGRQVERWLRERGAQHVVLLSRSGEPAVDVSDEDVLRQALRDLPPLRGVFHAAGVIDDGVLAQQSWERMREVLAPKIAGAWNLHRATLDQPLDYFVLFSSSTALLGSAGQTAYAAANAFLDALAAERRRRGLCAVSIQWGPWTDIGMMAKLDHDVRRRWIDRGFSFITPEFGTVLLEQALEQDEPCVGAFRVDWPRYRTASPKRRLLEELDAPQPNVAPSPATRSLIDELLALPMSERRPRIVQRLNQCVAKLLGREKPPGERVLLEQLGLDSLLSVELLHLLRVDFPGPSPLPATLLFDRPTVGALADYLLARLGG